MKRLPLENVRDPLAVARFIVTMIAGLGLDLWSKSAAVAHLRDSGREIVAIPGLLHFKYTVNYGAVFGIGQGQTGLFILVSVAAIVFLSYLFITSGAQRFYQVILGLLLAGVLGNMYDRIQYGYVRDMLYALPGLLWSDFSASLPQREMFPWIFNVADSLLCVGVGLMLIHGVVVSFAQSRQTRRAGDRISQGAGK